MWFEWLKILYLFENCNTCFDCEIRLKRAKAFNCTAGTWDYEKKKNEATTTNEIKNKKNWKEPKQMWMNCEKLQVVALQSFNSH